METGKFTHFISIAAALWLSSTAVAGAAPVNPLLAFLSTSCSGDELGKVTRVAILDARQANAIFKKGKAAQVAKQGDVYVQVFAKSKAMPNDFFMSKIDRAPTSSEMAEIIGKTQCTESGG